MPSPSSATPGPSLTLVDGDAAGAALAGALARVTGLVPYLTAEIDPADSDPAHSDPAHSDPAGGEWMRSAALIDDPLRLGRVIRFAGAGLGTDDPVVAASAFVQAYSYRVLALSVACFSAAGVVPDASAARVAIAVSGSWPSRLAFLRPRVALIGGATDVASLSADSDAITDALRFVVDTTVDAHLAPLLAAVRAGIGVPLGERLLWGNVAASAATAFRTMEGCLGPFVAPLGERFFALAPAVLRGLGSFRVVDHTGRRGWFWERTSCCLLDRLPGAPRCADCSLTPAADRDRAYRAVLDPSGAATPDG